VATVSCHGSAASLLSATPADGYGVTVGDGGSDEIEMQFTSSKHEYRLHVRCTNGQPTLVTGDHSD
jgi:hypothetical protein